MSQYYNADVGPVSRDELSFAQQQRRLSFKTQEIRFNIGGENTALLWKCSGKYLGSGTYGSEPVPSDDTTETWTRPAPFRVGSWAQNQSGHVSEEAAAGSVQYRFY